MIRLIPPNRNDVAGSLGDLGTFIPFFIGLVSIVGFSAASVLFFAGLWNILTGLVFDVPMVIQPMKALGVIAISGGLTAQQTIAAGIALGAIILVLSVTGLFGRLMRALPKSVVRGVQLGLGLLLLKTGVDLIAKSGVLWAPDSYVIGLTAALVAFVLFNNSRVPAALVVTGFGLLLMILFRHDSFSDFSISLFQPTVDLPYAQFDDPAVLLGVFAQFPLTLANSLVATAALVKDYFPDKGERVTIDRIGLSVGLMNLVGCPFGAMPMCHGAGGLAAQYRFGARRGISLVVLGAALIFLGLFVGPGVLALVRAFPLSVVGALLIIGGVELATHIKDIHEYNDVFVMVLTAGLALIVNVGVGFVVGLILAHYWRFNGTRLRRTRKS